MIFKEFLLLSARFLDTITKGDINLGTLLKNPEICLEILGKMLQIGHPLLIRKMLRTHHTPFLFSIVTYYGHKIYIFNEKLSVKKLCIYVSLQLR